ncbi:hypothetical protein AX16_007368 [Volvariella volvacea WC 439]|nr:hypothetical protein AX16_007368 [Volvariella volvacea WC 439]
MTTSYFKGKLGNVPMVFIVDLGSEMNLMSGAFYEKTSLTLDIDGHHWFLHGINSELARLAGCVRNALIEIGSHHFNHHFFVNDNGLGSQDVILGQLWLQWYAAEISYAKTGAVSM